MDDDCRRSTDGQLTMVASRCEPFVVDDSQVARLYAGHVPRVVAHLQQRGYAVQVIDETRIGAPVNAKLVGSKQLSTAARELLAAVHGKAGGQIVVTNHRQAAGAVKLLCRLYPESQTLVISKNQAENERLYRRVGPFKNRPVVCYPELQFKRRQIMFCPQPPLGWINQDEWQQILVVGQEAGLALNTLERALRSRQRLRFCIRTDGRLDSQALLRLEAAFGPVIYRVRPAKAEPEAIVDLLPAPLESYAINDSPQTGRRRRRARQTQGQSWHRQRQHLWYSRRRNQFIAGLAQALIGKDKAMLETFALTDPELLLTNMKYGIRILVETPEHGRQLQRLLPAWELFDARPCAEDREVAIHYSIAHLCPAIVTFAQAARDGLSAGVILRVDGTATPWQRSWSPQSPQPFSILDLTDDFDPEATTSWRRRLTAYRLQGWTINQFQPQT